MNQKQFLKIIKRCIGYGILLAIILAVWPISIDKTYPALEINLDDPSHVVERTIVVSGKYSPFYGSDRFDGSLQVSGYPITNLKLSTVFIDKQWGGLRYSDGTREGARAALGNICTQRWMRNFVLLVYRNQVPLEIAKGIEVPSNWSSGNGYCIVPNASSREDAIDRVARYFKAWT